MTAKLEKLAKDHSDMLTLYNLSETSHEGRQLWVMKVSTEDKRSDLKPMVKYVANMHGNEAVGKELLLHFIEYLVTSFKEGSDPNVTKLVSTTEIHIMPSMNPDGFERSSEGSCTGVSGRYNTFGKDLNRNFPTWDSLNSTRELLVKYREPETQAVIHWILDNPFVLSINFHDGAVVANYPYDDSDGPEGNPSLTDDDAVFKDLARTYASNHAYMHKGSGICQNDNFPEGITNGAQWYIVSGGLQDFNYLFSNCFEITIELSCCKYPLEEDLDSQWEANKNSLVQYLLKVHQGIKGHVRDINGNPLSKAYVIVQGINKPIRSTASGEYWRLLRPGQYMIQAKDDDGNYCDFKQVTVSSEEPLVLDLILDKNDKSNTNRENGAMSLHHILHASIFAILLQFLF